MFVNSRRELSMGRILKNCENRLEDSEYDVTASCKLQKSELHLWPENGQFLAFLLNNGIAEHGRKSICSRMYPEKANPKGNIRSHSNQPVNSRLTLSDCLQIEVGFLRKI